MSSFGLCTFFLQTRERLPAVSPDLSKTNPHPLGSISWVKSLCKLKSLSNNLNELNPPRGAKIIMRRGSVSPRCASVSQLPAERVESSSAALTPRRETGDQMGGGLHLQRPEGNWERPCRGLRRCWLTCGHREVWLHSRLEGGIENGYPVISDHFFSLSLSLNLKCIPLSYVFDGNKLSFCFKSVFDMTKFVWCQCIIARAVQKRMPINL